MEEAGAKDGCWEDIQPPEPTMGGQMDSTRPFGSMHSPIVILGIVGI